MNEYGSNNRRNNVIGNGSQYGRPTRPEQRRPAKQFVSEEEYIPRERRVSQSMRTGSSHIQTNERQYKSYEEEFYSNNTDYLPSRKHDETTANRKKRYSNIGRENVNAGYDSVPGRVRQKEREFDDYNFDLYQDEYFNPSYSSSKNKQIDFNANDFDDFNPDELFESFDIDEFEEYSKQEYEDYRNNERNERKKKKIDKDTKNKKSDIVFLLLACFEAALSLFLIVLLLIVDIIPTIWLIVAIVLLVVIAAGLILTQIKKVNRNAKLRLAGRIICIFMCVVLIAGSYFVALTKKAIDAVSSETGYTINKVHVAVLTSDKAESLKDVKNETFGTMSSFKPLILNEAMKAIEKEAGSKLKTQDYANQIELIDALYSKKTRVIIFNNDLMPDMAEKHENLNSEIKIIYTFKSKTKINIKSNTNVNVTTQPFLFFISGNDEYGELSIGGRSDVNMLIAVNPVSHEVLLISVPRDYYVIFPGISGTARDKITHAGIYGLDTQIDTMKELFGYDIDFYGYVNFSSFIDIIDAIGGIDIDVEMSFVSNQGVSFKGGLQHLSGDYALEYVRERQAFFDGDFARGRHQQQVIEAIIHKLLSSTGLTAYSQLVNTLERVCVTNIPKESISALIKKQLAEGGGWNISKVQAEGVPMTQPSYASGGIGLSVVMPYTGSINLVKKVMGQLYAGEKVEARQMQDGDDYSYVITPLPVEETLDEDEEETMETETTSEEETGEEETGEEESSEEGGSEEETTEESGGGEEETTEP